MKDIRITLNQIQENFDVGSFERGFEYYRKNKVKNLEIIGGQILSIVQGSQKYRQEIFIDADDIEGICSCPVGYNCKHVAAATLKAYETFSANKGSPKNKEEDVLTYESKSWIGNIQKIAKDQQGPEDGQSASNRKLVFILEISRENNYPALKIEPHNAYIKKDGSFSDAQTKKYDVGNIVKSRDKIAKHFTVEDIEILQRLNDKKYYGSDNPSNASGLIKIVTLVLQSNKAYLGNLKSNLLSLGEDKEVNLSWKWQDDASQKLVVEEFEEIFLFGSWFYLDRKNNKIGLIKTKLPKDLELQILKAPKIKPYEVEKISEILKEHINENYLPQKPKNFEQKTIAPKIKLRLHNILLNSARYFYQTLEVKVPAATISFEYGSRIVDKDNVDRTLTYADGDSVISVKRDAKLESEAHNIVEQYGLENLESISSTHNHKYHDKKFNYIFSDEKSYHYGVELNDEIENSWIEFILQNTPKLEKLGWEIQMENDFLVKVMSADDQWYNEIDESSSNGWFSLDLGIEIDGVKTSLLPILVSLIKNNKNIFEDISKMRPDSIFKLPFEDGRKIAVSFEKIKPIMLFLKELALDNSSYKFDENRKLKISRFSLARLAELKESDKSLKLRWIGNEELLNFANKLRQVKEIKPQEPPKDFTIDLYGYQKLGLGWLQFLRKCNIAGILADDMGLGKTVQVLAHIGLEKENKLLNNPVLIIAPTSVVYNWQSEIARITPGLKSLLLHGDDRKCEYDNINEYDIVITTYNILSRDKEFFLAQKFCLLVLDEAQYIKNSKAKATLVCNQINADNRLCLTGTPMENNLGELWSIFNFLLPGFLGEKTSFNRLFRNPIEKKNDADSKMMLAKRIEPFFLRRTKDLTIKELPPKTNIIRHIELSGSQRELYEVTRLMMVKEVQKEIDKKGIERSHIKILEALLRLRQTCCDPRILNLEHAKKVKDSAKLEHLMEMLPRLIAEGRKILIFSQFVKMLEIIESECQKINIDYVKLTGASKDRKKLVDKFQSGTIPLFLISLKAGGVGLNLTAADTVIHYDPWWNPAVENQATDRAYRIGQDKPVFVYKLITANTVEEKILEMQDKKRDLADNLFNANKDSSLKFTKKDFDNLFAPVK